MATRTGARGISISALWYAVGLIFTFTQGYWDVSKWGNEKVAHVINALLAAVLGPLLYLFRVTVAAR